MIFSYAEKHVAYAESHDQALVGDKTIAFWLMDKGELTYKDDFYGLHDIFYSQKLTIE